MHTRSWLIGVVMLALSVSCALALFTGLEWHSGYAGTTFKALHPESFPGDPYMTDQNPMRLSSYYGLVRLVGDRWLDDRLLILVYGGLLLLALIGVDKTARLLGATGATERLFVLGMMAFGHRFRDSYGHIVTNADFYAGTFASVVAIWLFALALARARMWMVAACGFVLWSLTAKWAWLPSLIAIVIVSQDRFTPRQRRIALGAGALSVVGLYLAYLIWVRPPGREHIVLFDYLNRLEGSEGNPFLDPFPWSNALYAFMLALGWVVTPPEAVQRRRVRTVVVIGALLWLLGGLYLTYAPDALKIPYLIPLAFNGATQWPQYLLFLSISVGALIHLRTRSSRLRTIALVGVLAALYATFSPMRMAKFGVAAVAATGAWWLLGRITSWRVRVSRPALAGVLAAAAVGSTLFAYVRGTVVRYPDLRFLARHGVMGGNPSAKWVGVNAYIRTHTPPDAVILPIVASAYRSAHTLAFDKWLQTRTGRSLPVGVPFSVWFDFPALQELDVKLQHMDQLLAAWARRDAAGVNHELAYFRSVDYLLAENSEAAWMRNRLIAYHPEATVGDFTLFRRIDRAQQGG